MKTPEEIIKEKYPFYDENYVNKDIELDGKQITELMIKYADQYKQVKVEPEVILQGELLPCPFCKTLPEKYQVGERPTFGEKGTTYVKCKNINCAIFGSAILLVKWNKRAGREPKSK